MDTSSHLEQETKREFLSRLVETLDLGLSRHPTSQSLFRLRDDLKKEILLTVVSDRSLIESAQSKEEQRS